MNHYFFKNLKNIGYTLIMMSWILVMTGILNGFVIPYNTIVAGPADIQTKKIMLSLNGLFWYFIPAALTGVAGGYLIHKFKKNNNN